MVERDYVREIGRTGGFCSGRTGLLRRSKALPPGELALWLKAEALVERLASRSGIELDGADAALFEILHAVRQELRSNATTPMLRVHEEHANPAEVRSIGNGSRSAGERAVALRDKAAFRFASNKALPV